MMKLLARKVAQAVAQACTLVAIVLCAPGAWAQGYPERPVRIIVGFAPGGSPDTVARLLAQQLGAAFGQPVLVENKPGAGGMIASDYVSKSPPDGHTLVLVTGAHSTQAAIMKQLPYEPVSGLGWISSVVRYPFLVVTHPQSPYKSLADVVARAKAAPGVVNYGSAGLGTSHHMLAEWLASETGIDIMHIPFKAGPSTVFELMAGRVDFMFETIVVTLPQVKAGKLRAIAVTTSEPLSALPEVPPVSRTVPQLVFQSWLALAAAPGTPAPIVERLNRELRRVLGQPEVQKRFADLGGQASPSSPDEMRAQVSAEVERWKALVKSRGIERQ